MAATAMLPSAMRGSARDAQLEVAINRAYVVLVAAANADLPTRFKACRALEDLVRQRSSRQIHLMESRRGLLLAANAKREDRATATDRVCP